MELTKKHFRLKIQIVNKFLIIKVIALCYDMIREYTILDMIEKLS